MTCRRCRGVGGHEGHTGSGGGGISLLGSYQMKHWVSKLKLFLFWLGKSVSLESE